MLIADPGGALTDRSAAHGLDRHDRLRVLVLSHLYPSAAQVTRGIFVHRQVLGLKELGLDLRVVAPVPVVPFGAGRFGNYRYYSRVPPFDRVDSVDIVYPRYAQPPRNILTGLASLVFARAVRSAVVGLALDFRPHLIHGHMATPDGYAATRLGQELGLPVVCTLRGSDINVAPKRGPLIRRLTVATLRDADAVTAVSGSLAREAKRLVERDVEVVYTGLDTERFRSDPQARGAIRAAFGVQDGTCVIGLVANLIRQKGVRELLEAFHHVAAAGRDAVLWFVGDGPDADHLRRMVDRHGLTGRVRFVGRVAHDRVPGFLNALDVMALPSHREGLPNVVVEALACECPVIATRVGGVAEVLSHGQTGWLVDVSDPDGLLDALLRLVDGPGLRRSLGVAGRRSVVDRYSWVRNATSMAEVYHTVVARRAKHAAPRAGGND